MSDGMFDRDEADRKIEAIAYHLAERVAGHSNEPLSFEDPTPMLDRLIVELVIYPEEWA